MAGTLCSYHCRNCGRCFASLGAFDAHRKGPHDDRRCENPLGLERREGRCNLGSGELETRETIIHGVSA
jgi:hypothetical protein